MKFRTLIIAVALMAAPSVAYANHATNAQEAYKEANDKMMEDMMKPLSGDPDKDFIMMMMPHHQGAIDMAKAELKYGKDKTLRAMAEAIIQAQEKEIKEMEAWKAANP